MFIGKTNMTEFGAKASSDSPLSGITSNPEISTTQRAVRAGAAASVAAGVTSFAIGMTRYLHEYQPHSADWLDSNQLMG